MGCGDGQDRRGNPAQSRWAVPQAARELPRQHDRDTRLGRSPDLTLSRPGHAEGPGYILTDADGTDDRTRQGRDFAHPRPGQETNRALALDGAAFRLAAGSPRHAGDSRTV